jgi:hypothetical protein
MISNAFRFLALLAVPAALAVAPALGAEALFPTGSLIGFVPPPGFTVSKHFPGFENSDGGSMVLLTLPP